MDQRTNHDQRHHARSWASRPSAALVAQGARTRGVEELQRAHQSLVACGARREADAAARRLRRLGRRVARPGRPGPDGGLVSLSAREREVAEQVAAGKTNRLIAAALFLSEKTVESHLARIYDKIAVRSRVALAATSPASARETARPSEGPPAARGLLSLLGSARCSRRGVAARMDRPDAPDELS